MRQSEQVTFGASGLDRAAQLRGDAAALARLWQSGESRVLALWRGKVPVAGDRLLWLPTTDPFVAAQASKAVFLGLDGTAGLFAVDRSDWTPTPGAEVEPLPGIRDTTLQPADVLPEAEGFTDLRNRMASLGPRDAELGATARAILEWHRSHGFCAACGARSTLSQAGWQSTCTTCGRHHFPRTDPVVIMLITHGNSVLLGRSPGWPDKMYSLLAGFIEPGETIENAVRREVAEESGIKVGRVDYLSSQPWPFPASLMLGCRGEALSHDITIDPAEIEDAIWVSREELTGALAGENTRLSPARPGSMAQFLLINWLADRLD